MDQVHTHCEHEAEHQPAEKTRVVTLRIPKPNWQVTALILIALIAGFQTIQLVRLKDSVAASAAATTTTASSSVPAAASSGSSALPSQVGGC